MWSKPKQYPKTTIVKEIVDEEARRVREGLPLTIPLAILNGAIKQRFPANYEKRKAVNDRWRARNRERLRAYSRRYYRENKDAIYERRRGYIKEYYQKNRDVIKEKRKARYQKNKERLNKQRAIAYRIKKIAKKVGVNNEGSEHGVQG